MPDISAEIAAFKNAVYGEDVRGAMISLANKLNDVVDENVEDITSISENAANAIRKLGYYSADILVQPNKSHSSLTDSINIDVSPNEQITIGYYSKNNTVPSTMIANIMTYYDNTKIDEQYGLKLNQPVKYTPSANINKIGLYIPAMSSMASDDTLCFYVLSTDSITNDLSELSSTVDGMTSEIDAVSSRLDASESKVMPLATIQYSMISGTAHSSTKDQVTWKYNDSMNVCCILSLSNDTIAFVGADLYAVDNSGTGTKICTLRRGKLTYITIPQNTKYLGVYTANYTFTGECVFTLDFYAEDNYSIQIDQVKKNSI